MNHYKYSIIIPHKNTPSLLIRCVASIPNRDDLQIVIVDDNSDPSIVDFDNFPIKNDERTVIIFDKSSKGAGRARNIGMENATGEKFIFADADDFFNYCFNEVLDEYKDDTTDIVFFNASSCNSTTYVNNKNNRADFINELIQGYDSNPELYDYYLRYERGAPWSKIIRKDLITNNKVTFQESIVNNDTRFSYTTGHLAKSIKVDQRAIYCVTFLQSSISNTMNNDKYITGMHIIAKQELFCKQYRQKFCNCKSYPIIYLRNNLVNIYQSNNKGLYNECLKILDSYGIGKETKAAVKKRLLHIKVAVFIVSISKAPLKWIKFFK